MKKTYTNKKAYPKKPLKQKSKSRHRQLTKSYILKTSGGLEPVQDIADYKRCADIWNYT